MSAPSHTPAPWEAHDLNDSESDGIEIMSEARGGFIPIALIETGFDEPMESEQQANARLIAAAPELLEALKDMLGWNNCLNRPIPEGWSAQAKEVCGRALTAIAKATGQEVVS